MAEFFVSGYTARKVSEFYVLLWAELTRLTGEYRWLTLPTDREPVRTVSDLIRELEVTVGPNIRFTPRLSSELDRTLSLKSTWECAKVEERESRRAPQVPGEHRRSEALVH